MPVHGDTSLPIAPRNASWNGSDARRRVVDFYTKNGTTDWTQVKKAFFWSDPGKEDMLTGYSLGFADIVSGKLQIVDNGVFAVAGGHGVTRIQGPSATEKATIKRKVNAIYGRMKAKWPNDRFNFDPPFTSGKSADDGEDDMDEEEVNDLDTQIEAVKQKFYVGGAESFADLTAMRAVNRAIEEVFDTVRGFQMLARNVAGKSETPKELLTKLKALTSEMAKIFDEMDFSKEAKETPTDKALTIFINGDEVEWDVKQGNNGNAALLKNSKGDQFFYGRFTNNLYDRDGEVLITEAHKEFVDYLDDNPHKAPELWAWHERETAYKNRAIWWDYADGFLHTIWPVTEEEAKGIEAFMKEFDPGMSHGFQVLERNKSNKEQIAKYRTEEASILPVDYAANQWTTFALIEEAEGKEKMFTPEKQRALDLLSLGKYKLPLGKASEVDAQAIDESGAQRKNMSTEPKEGDDMSAEVKKTKEDEANPPATPAPAATATAPVATSEKSAIDEATIVEALQLTSDRITAIEVMLKEHANMLKGIKETKGQSPSVAAWVASQKAATSIGEKPEPAPESSKDGAMTDDDPLFGAGPEEESFKQNDHLLAGL